MEKTTEIILSYERRYAAQLSTLIMDKPKLSSLMIFIPFLFIFFIQDLLKYKKARKEFAINFLLSREKALKEALDVLSTNRKVDTSSIAEKSGLNKRAAGQYAEFLNVLTTHYLCLLKGNGNDYEAMVRSAYTNNKKSFEGFLDRLTQTELSLNKTLKQQMKKEQSGVSSTIKKIETGNRKLRKEATELIFG